MAFSLNSSARSGLMFIMGIPQLHSGHGNTCLVQLPQQCDRLRVSRLG
jgi:hypothetical protein